MIFFWIWERYFIRRFMGIFFLFLSCFYGLYVLIDYATHTGALASHSIHIGWENIVRYYFYIFSARAEILIPLALLIAFVHTVCTLNIQHELIALMAGGFSIRLLMRPFIFAALCCVLLMYINEQFILPKSLLKLKRIESLTKHQKRHPESITTVKQVVLEDGSLFFYQEYDSLKEQFFDAYWIQSIDSIYRIKYLSPRHAIPIGYFVDHLVRQDSGELLQKDAYKELPFAQMKFGRNLLQSTIIDPDILSVSDLAKEIQSISDEPNNKESEMLTAFYWKLSIPWLCLFAIIAPAPYCVRFSRQLPVFLITLCSLFGLIALYLFLDAAQVVAKRQVISPIWAICCPFAILFCYYLRKFIRHLA